MEWAAAYAEAGIGTSEIIATVNASGAECSQARAAMLLRKFDENNDGHLDLQELQKLIGYQVKLMASEFKSELGGWTSSDVIAYQPLGDQPPAVETAAAAAATDVLMGRPSYRGHILPPEPTSPEQEAENDPGHHVVDDEAPGRWFNS